LNNKNLSDYYSKNNFLVFLMERIVPDVLIGDKINFLPEISVMKVIAEITVSLV